MKKFVGLLLVLVLVLGMAVPVKAMEMPEFPYSFEFAVSYRQTAEFRGDLPWYMADFANMFGGNGFSSDVSGVFVRDGFAAQLFVEAELGLENIFASIPEFAPMMSLLNLDLNEPFRVWIDVDFSDLSDPSAKLILEMPTIVRLPLLFVDAGLARQFWVMDLSDMLAELIEESEVEIRQISDEQREEFFMQIEDFLEGILEELDDFFDEAEEMVTIHDYSYGLTILENAVSAYMAFVATVVDGGIIADVDFEFSLDITNINSAERVAMPRITGTNSFDLTSLF